MDSQPMKIVVTGAAGRMGQAVIRLLQSGAQGAVLAGALVRPGHAWEGQDLGQALGGAAWGLKVSSDPLPVFAAAAGGAVIDFSNPEASLGFAALAAQARLVHVIGTTGFDAVGRAALDRAAYHAVQIRSGNMSLGVALLAKLVEKAAAALGPEWDIEITEAHHRGKRDAPSGTALLLGAAAAKGRGATLESLRLPAHEGLSEGPRPQGGIGFSALRAGDIVGEHQVMLAGAGERITLGHIATDRGIFARGAVKAALWGRGQKPGVYGMADVLGL